MNIFNHYKKDSAYLAKYHTRRMFFAIMAVAGVLALYPPSIQVALFAVPLIYMVGSLHIGMVIAGVVLASGYAVSQPEFSLSQAILMFVASFALANIFTGLIHNASHGNIKPRWLNKAIGEVCGFIQLVGFSDWHIIHVLHHSHTDDPELDPHAPGEMAFVPFLLQMRQQILKVVLTSYFKIHGKSEETVKHITRMGKVSRIEHLAKVGFWYFALGPQMFAFLFAPSIVFKMVVLAWLNHSAHRKVDGKNVILNKNQGFYKVVNFFSFNLYFHENHHVNPKLFNPRKMERTSRAEGPSPDSVAA